MSDENKSLSGTTATASATEGKKANGGPKNENIIARGFLEKGAEALKLAAKYAEDRRYIQASNDFINIAMAYNSLADTALRYGL